MPSIQPCLWFDTQALEAAEVYTSLFPDSEITRVRHYGRDEMRPEGTVLTVEFTLRGQPYTALNGGPQFTFSEAISLEVHCESAAEVDHYWDALTADGGEEGPCGWLKDRFGLSWQVVPVELTAMLDDPDEAKRHAVMQAMLATVGKLDVERLRAAYADA